MAARVIFQGRIVELVLETVRLPGGQRPTLEIVRHPGGAAVVALDERERLCLLRQYRHAIGGWLWEIPAGKIDAGEGPETTARRELAEEAGRSARRWIELGAMHSSPGFCTEAVHLYLATGLRPVPIQHEPEEVIEIHWLPFAQVLDWCREGRLTDAKTLIGIFRAAAYLETIDAADRRTPE